jgi:hypothetical protein
MKSEPQRPGAAHRFSLEVGKLLDLAHEAIVVRSFSDGKIVRSNRGAERMYG